MRAAVLVGAVLAAGVAMAADVTVKVQLTIPDAQVAEWRKMMDADVNTFPPLYTNVTVVANRQTNAEQRLVVETDKQRAARISAEVLANWWRRQTQAYRNRTMPTLAPAPVVVPVQ